MDVLNFQMKNKIILSKTTEYQWCQNWAHSIAHTDINKVVAELKEIEEVHGNVTPQLVVDSSKNKSSILHNYFDWDNETAANKWRLRQASKLLGHIEVKIIKDNEPKIVRAFLLHHKGGTDGSETKYKSLDFSDEKMKKINISFSLSNLTSAKNKLLYYDDCVKVVEYINKAIEELSKESTETKEIKPVLSAVV